jgi:hypothetical protein
VDRQPRIGWTWGRLRPAASMTARTSSIRCSSVGISDTRSESPVPRYRTGSAARRTRAARRIGRPTAPPTGIRGGTPTQAPPRDRAVHRRSPGRRYGLHRSWRSASQEVEASASPEHHATDRPLATGRPWARQVARGGERRGVSGR